MAKKGDVLYAFELPSRVSIDYILLHLGWIRSGQGNDEVIVPTYTKCNKFGSGQTQAQLCQCAIADPNLVRYEVKQL